MSTQPAGDFYPPKCNCCCNQPIYFTNCQPVISERTYIVTQILNGIFSYGRSHNHNDEGIERVVDFAYKCADEVIRKK